MKNRHKLFFLGDSLSPYVSGENNDQMYGELSGGGYTLYSQITNSIYTAIIYLERAIELEPQEMEITDHLGDAYFKVGRKKEAKLVWERALSLNGDVDLLNKIKNKLEINFNYNMK